MDNPQASLRVAQAAGMWLADGFVTAKWIEPKEMRRAKTAAVSPQAGYVSKDYDYIEFLADVLKENGIGRHISERRKLAGRAQTWNLNVNGHKRFRAWFETFEPYLFGRKLEAARALYSCYRPGLSYGGPGVLKSAEQIARERSAYERVRKLNSTEASETIMVGSR